MATFDPTQATDKATQWLASQRDPMESLLRDLVEVSSWTYDKAGTDQASQVLRAATPLRCAPVKGQKFGDQNVFHGARPASQGGIVLVGHIDTVFPKEKFSGYKSDGKIARGPGVFDMKGGLVVINFALKALQHVGALDRLALSYVVVTDEEIGSPEGAPVLRAAAQGAKASLVFESGRAGDAIVTRRKGTGALNAIAHGRAAHAGNGHKEGINAIWAISRFVDRIQGMTDYDKGTTLNVGQIAGGMGKNTVPDRAEAHVDLRFVSEVERQALYRSIEELVARDPGLGVQGARVELQWGGGRGPMEKTPASEALMQAYAQCQRESGLGHGECGLVGGGSDAATTSLCGVPSIDGLGPRGADFHTVDERMELDSMIPKAQALVRYLIREAASSA
jgi:glutamate carboxypeptidase